MKRRKSLAMAVATASAAVVGSLALGCANAGSSGRDHYRGGTVHADSFPDTYGSEYPYRRGRPGRYGY